MQRVAIEKSEPEATLANALYLVTSHSQGGLIWVVLLHESSVLCQIQFTTAMVPILRKMQLEFRRARRGGASDSCTLDGAKSVMMTTRPVLLVETMSATRVVQQALDSPGQGRTRPLRHKLRR
jgi:hypothetical protein